MASEWHQLCAQALSPAAVHDEPLIYSGHEALQAARDSEDPLPKLQHNVAVQRFWAHNTTAIFDVCITNTNTPTYRGKDPAKILARHEWEKG